MLLSVIRNWLALLPRKKSASDDIGTPISVLIGGVIDV